MKSLNFFRKFIQQESTSAVLLFAAALLALLYANSPWKTSYYTFFIHPFLIKINNYQINFSLNHFINEGLMPFFFLLVSMEIKRELLQGELNTRAKAILPVIAAIGGMILPALIYSAINLKNNTLNGWAIPTATDIAFSLALLNLLGKRIPIALKIFLTALAIIDDLGAIIIIALFYTAQIHLLFLFLAGLVFFILLVLNQRKIQNRWVYVIAGFLLWLCILKSGIHATIAGVLFAFTLPVQNNDLEGKLHPWVAFIILPIFAFANAGISLNGLQNGFLNPITLGIAAGLFLGKQLGIFSACWLAVKSGIAKLPAQITWRQIYGVCLLGGIGFTMSLFIGSLAFPQADLISLNAIRLGVISGSLLSGLLGYWVLHRTRA